jgi:CPA1 family monovalent cation:H+ antiporter
VLVAHGTLFVSGLFGIEMTLAGAYLFGAIISPTDPMAIKRITEGIRGNRTWATIIQGESLFNDAFALVAYTLAAGVVFSTTGSDPAQSLVALFIWEVLVSIGIGLGLALVSGLLLMIFGTNERDGRVLASIGLAAGSYALAAHLGASGPIAVVTTGLAVMWGFHHSRKFHTLDSVRDFWSMSERGLASMFFLLIGLEVLVVDWTLGLVVLGIAAWAVVFFARFLTVILGYLGSTLLYRLGSAVHFITPLTVGGVRGSISVALALSLPVVATDTLGQRKTIIALTFGAVVIGLLLQSSALELMSRKFNARQSNHPKFRHGVRSVLVGARQKRHRSQRRSRK